MNAPRAGQSIRATIRSTHPRSRTFELTRDADRFPTGWRLFYRQTCSEAHMHRMLCPARDAHEAVVVVEFDYEVVQ